MNTAPSCHIATPIIATVGKRGLMLVRRVLACAGIVVVCRAPQTYDTFQLSATTTTRLKGADAASQITQADMLQKFGSMLVVCGDTFVIRAYGESRDSENHVTARAWCEAVVQRTPEPANPDPATERLIPLIVAKQTDWGRKYVIESFRWLSPQEI